jgi:hypothetical protein
MTGVPLERAELATEKLSLQLADLGELRGIGIAILSEGYAIKLNLSQAIAHDLIPDEVDGVPVIVEIVGTISAY